MPQDVVRADIPPVFDGQEFIGFDPENSHGSQRTQTAFLPVTKFANATRAAEFKTTNVRAGSAMRDKGPTLTPTIAFTLRA